MTIIFLVEFKLCFQSLEPISVSIRSTHPLSYVCIIYCFNPVLRTFAMWVLVRVVDPAHHVYIVERWFLTPHRAGDGGSHA
jgi:hypothetical protein